VINWHTREKLKCGRNEKVILSNALNRGVWIETRNDRILKARSHSREESKEL
jgi:hypothetical protein